MADRFCLILRCPRLTCVRNWIVEHPFIPSMIKSKDSKKSSPSDWLQVGMDGGVLLLGLIQDVASLAPVPYLSTAAGLTIKIVDTVQVSHLSLSKTVSRYTKSLCLFLKRFRGNKEDFKQLAEDVTAIVAVVCDSYKESAKKDEWPPHDLVPVIADLLTWNLTLS